MSRMFTRHYNVNDITKIANVTLLLHAMSGRRIPQAFFLVRFLEICLAKRNFKLFAIANFVYNQYHTQ